ncbi:hypothetical protein B0T16DRAFT_192823 [Cercophora newfieldiana]|uniref:Ecp2 effector protein-like domain-containing protein n=1 Tax=Cercophora newfieldiana TaxID=92897 RepID=A0AA39Y1A6_9PEZI|nr:hypothetical protein B0T16DRAFT_192823 [Cercophora newfieldiana]
MPSSSFRLLAQQTLLSLLSLTTALVTPSPYEGLVPRDVTLADGTIAVVYENPALTFHKIRDADVLPSTLTKRLQYITYATPAAGRNDYCGEWNTVVSGGPDAPLASDCSAIAQAYTIQTSLGASGALGYWSISVADWNAAPGGWVTLAASGTCKFPVALSSGQPVQNALFGANDLRFYTNSAVGSAVGGKSEARGSVSCWNGTDGHFVSTAFRVTHV